MLRIYKIGRKFKRCKPLANFFFNLNRIINCCHIHPECNLGENIQFVHGGIGIVINRNVSFGRDVKIFQNVTIGNNVKGGIPTIGNNVTIYANSVVVGNITIGDNSIIGACSFVNKDVPENTIWAGVPAKQIGVING